MKPTDIKTIKNKYFLDRLLWHMEDQHTDENYEFLYSKLSNDKLYTTYIKAGVPKQVNISAAMRTEMDKLAASLSPLKWKNMAPHLQKARAEILGLINKGPLPLFLTTPTGKRARVALTLGLDGSKAAALESVWVNFVKPPTPADKVKAYKAMHKLAPIAKLDAALREVGLEPPVQVDEDKGIAKLELIRKHALSFKQKVTTPVMANTTGGPTWKKVQLIAQRVPPAIIPMLDQLESRDMARARETHLQTLKSQWDAITIDDVEKYMQEHGEGGAKSRAGGLKEKSGLYEKTIAAEKSRVALCALLIQRYKALDILIDRLKLDDLA